MLVWILRNVRKYILKTQGQFPELLLLCRTWKVSISKALEELNMFSTAHLPQNGVQCDKAMW